MDDNEIIQDLLNHVCEKFDFVKTIAYRDGGMAHVRIEKKFESTFGVMIDYLSYMKMLGFMLDRQEEGKDYHLQVWRK